MGLNQASTFMQRPSFEFNAQATAEQVVHLSNLERFIRENPGRILELCDPQQETRPEDTVDELVKYAVGKAFGVYAFDTESERVLSEAHPALSATVDRTADGVIRKKLRPAMRPGGKEAELSVEDSRRMWLGLFINREVTWQVVEDSYGLDFAYTGYPRMLVPFSGLRSA